MIARFAVFSARLSNDWEQARQAAEKALYAYSLLPPNEQEAQVYIDSAALNLYRFYSSLEYTLSWMARQLDNTIPQGTFWHLDLLTQMSMNVPSVRPALISPETYQQLRNYLGFRHIVRNIYSWEFELSRIEQLIQGLPAVLKAIDEDFANFQHFLEQAAHADE